MQKTEYDMKRKNLIILLLSLTPLIFTSCLYDAFHIPKFIWIFLLTALLFTVGIREKLFNHRNIFILPAGLLLLWSLITLVRCANIFAGLYYTVILLLFITLYISLENYVAEDNTLIDIFIKGTVIVSVIVSVYGLLQLAGIDFIVWGIQKSALSTLGRRNFAAEYLVMVIPYAYYLISQDRKKWFLYIPPLLLILHLAFTFTRASYIAFFVSGLVFLLLTNKKIPINRKMVILLCILLFSRVAFSYTPTFEKGTAQSRLHIWNIAFKMIKKNPVMGVGTGNFITTYPYYAIGEEKALRGVSLLVNKAHNDFLEVCSETGIPGLLLFLFLLVSFFRISFIAYKRSERRDKLLIAGIISSVSGICVNALASFPFHNPATLLLFWANLSFIGGIYRKLKGETEIKVSYPLLRLYLGLFIIAGLVMGFASIKSSRYLLHANIANDKTALQLAEKSVSYNPFSTETTFFAAKTATKYGDYKTAFKYIKMERKLNPYSDNLYNNLGLVYSHMTYLKEAEESFLYSLKLNPIMPNVHNNLGVLYLNTERYDEAIPCFKNAIALKSNFDLAYFNLGLTYYLKKDYREAEKHIRKLLEINPHFDDAPEFLAEIASHR